MSAYPRRGEVYLARLDKLRPVIILSVDSLNRYALDVCIVPVTTIKRAEFSMRVPLKIGEGGLRFDCWAKCDQVTTLEKSALQESPLGLLPAGKFHRVQEQVKISLGLF
ncbi:MAG TPA: type II toxin-antitoxin system PemK/MazF family toxin [Terriglobia bacterium]|nr:type II toxin-antitoxin system PemK/MazF family toxin [Terriglobia bacterium]